MPKVLIVDDDPSVREFLKITLKPDYTLLEASQAREAIELFRQERPDLVLLDILLPEISGMECLKQFVQERPDAKVIMITAVDRVKVAVEAMQLGAFDYIPKPFDVETLRLVVDRAIHSRQMEQEIHLLRSEVDQKYQFQNIIGKSPQMQEIFRVIEQVADKDSTVLILGESGTGKELVARAIHEMSSRNDKNFVGLNCAAIPEHLIESELFGHEKGAFTDAFERKMGQFEAANNGTLFLDEIGDLSLSTQVKILRVLQEKEFHRVGGTTPIKVDVRLIAATNKDLEEAIRQGKFREDLYFRINVVPITISPLRQRREDIPILANHYAELLSKRENGKVRTLSQKAMEVLMSYDWPGNVRELQNVLERTLGLVDRDVIYPDDLPPEIREAYRFVKRKESVLEGEVTMGEAEKEFERELILNALRKSKGIQTKAAQMLGVSRRILKYKMDKYSINYKDL
ncbi:MAG: sigma-54-dependent Fis family transcriptional regulator [Deltaproteobacteria bacterium]|nr:sigma-54-dependent Fis family transcriptional regulator [Deltaproteobacteria bacterium]